MPASIGIVYTVEDRKGAASNTIINVPSGTTMPDAILFAQQMALLIDPMVTGRITRAGISLTVDLSSLGLGAVASDTSDVEEGARFQFTTAGNFRTSNRIPTFDETKVTVGGTDVDQVDADVAAFIAAMEDGINLVGVGGSGTVGPTDSRDDDITATSLAKEAFQSSR
jgi:hypothetical protein